MNDIDYNQMNLTSKFISLITFAAFLYFTSCKIPNKKTSSTSIKDTIYDLVIKSLDSIEKKSPKPLTKNIIDTTSDQMLLEVILNNLNAKLPEDNEEEYETVNGWSKSKQTIYVIGRLEAEVNNGGYNQFYYNSSGKYADLVPEALKSIGAKKFFDLMINANVTYKKEKNKIVEKQDGTIEGFQKSYENNPLSKLDDRFYVLYESEDLAKLQIKFIRKHVSDFIDE